jgi:hypothetical protein
MSKIQVAIALTASLLSLVPVLNAQTEFFEAPQYLSSSSPKTGDRRV